jgi:hypothetical protein
VTGPWARFDDLRSVRSVRFVRVAQVLTAEREDDVVPVLAASLRVADRQPDDPPLAWFGLADPPERPAPLGPPTRRL